MRRPAKERGKPDETKYSEFYRLLKKIKPKKTDVFYDLGCGYGNTCKWISKYVKLAVGIENYSSFYEKAIENTVSKKYPNVKIIKTDFSKFSIKQATIVYSLMVDFPDLIKIIKEVRDGTKIIFRFLPPEFPIKYEKFGEFFIFKKPLERVKDKDEYVQLFLGKKTGIIKELKNELTKDEVRRWRWYFARGESNWNAIKSKNS